MKAIDNRKVFSHVSQGEMIQLAFGKPQKQLKNREKSGYFSVTEIRKSKGYKVSYFDELISLVAELGYRNHRYNLLFRGQCDDYKDKYRKTIVYPSLFRPLNKRLTKKVIKGRYDKLNKGIDALFKAREKIGVHSILKNHREYYIALIQHYRLLETPMIDLTQSLLIAVSFALQEKQKGYLYVFGMPHPNGSISHFIDDNLVLVKLQNVCPPEAKRPHAQEGYLVGRLPTSKTKEAGDNLARRLIGKYFLDNTNNTFWKCGFKKIPKNVLCPSKDDYADKLKTILNKNKL